MKSFKERVISKGKPAKTGRVHTRDILVGDLIECFIPKPGSELSYLGYAYYSVRPDGALAKQEEILKEFFIEVDRVARPRWCPKFFLRLLDLFGNDGSIVRVRNFKLHNLFNKITGGVRITDTKWKWDSFRIYGNFTEELRELAKETCTRIEEECR